MNKTERNPHFLNLEELNLEELNLEELKELLKEFPFLYKHARPNIAIDLCSIGISYEQVQENRSLNASKSDNKKAKGELVVFIQRKSEFIKQKNDNGEEEQKSAPWCLPGRFMKFAERPGARNETQSGEVWTETLARVKKLEWPIRSEVAGRITAGMVEYEVPVNEDCLYNVPFLDRIDRDPRGRVVSLPIVTFIGSKIEPIPEGIEHVARWVPIRELLRGKEYEDMIGYDHKTIVELGLRQLLVEAATRPLGKGLVSKDTDFDLQELVDIYNVLFNRNFSKSNIKKMLEVRMIIRSNATNSLEQGQRRRGERFHFVDEVYDRYKDDPLKFTFLPRTKEE